MSQGILKLFVKNYILRKPILKFMNVIFGIFGKKFILKHFMHRTIPKRCVLGVFWPAQYVSEVYFTRRRLLLTLLTFFYGYIAFGCIYTLLTLKNKTKKKKKFKFTNSYILGIHSRMVFLLISAKNRETFILTLILFFHFPIKLVLSNYGPFSWSASHIFFFIRVHLKFIL